MTNTPTIQQIAKKPKVSLRRFTDRNIKLAIEEYILNRGTQAEAVSLANLRARL